MREVVPEGGERPVHMAGLTASVAMGPDELGPAIEAGAVARPLPLAGTGFDGARGKPARHRFADAFQTPADHGRNMTEAKGRVETLCIWTVSDGLRRLPVQLSPI